MRSSSLTSPSQALQTNKSAYFKNPKTLKNLAITFARFFIVAFVDKNNASIIDAL